MRIPLLLLVFALVTAPAAAQLPTPPADSVLAAITARGRMLQQYDIAAWHGGDAIAALNPAPGEATASFAVRKTDGSWELIYGRLSGKKDTFYVTLNATQAGDSTFTASRFAKPTPGSARLREMALAFETAQRQFGKVDRPYNSYILPAPAGGFWVYLLPAQTNPASFPLGGDIRYRIVNGTTIADSVRFHRTILNRQTGTQSNGGAQVASIHTSFDSLPSESDVFVVLRQFPRLPEIVATRDFTYEIATNGTITWVRSGNTSKPLAPPPPPMVTTPGHIPVWRAKVDTVGSAPRTISPGYTEWRDTTTGWRMTFDRVVPIKGSDSASYNGSWHTLMLADGTVLVTRGFPAAAIQVYDIEGRYVRDIGRVGSGPEEFMTTPTLAMKGDTIVALDGIQARVMLFALDGHFIRSFQVGARGSPIPVGVDPRGYVRVQQRFGVPFGDSLSRMQWLYYTTRGVLVDSIRRPPLPEPKTWRVLDGTNTSSFAVPFSPAYADLFLPDGTLMYGTADRFEFVVTRNGRDTTRIFGRSDRPPVPIAAGFIDTIMTDMTRGQPLLQQVIKRSDFPTNFPIWNSATVDEKGYVWVSVGLSGRTPNSIAIFGPDGRYLGMAPLWWQRIDQMSFGADRMAYVWFDKDRRAVLRIYKVDRRGM